MAYLTPGRLCALFLLAAPVPAAQPCFAPDAIWNVRSIGDPQLAPDGKSVAYVHSWNDSQDDAGYSNLEAIAAEGGEARRITEGKYHDSSPRWSPDGRRLAYLSDRGGAPAIHVREMGSGADRVLVTGAERVANLTWSPDGRYLAYMAFVPSEPEWAPAMPAKPAGAHWAADAVSITKLRWTFDGIGILKPGATRIFVVAASGGEARQISRDPYQHTSYMAEPDLAWSSDSRSVLASAVKAKDGWAVYDRNEIYAFPVEGGNPRQLGELKGHGFEAAASPDGAVTAFTGYTWRGQSYHVKKLRLLDGQGKLREVTTDWDRDVSKPVWAAGSKKIYFLGEDRGDVNLYETDLAGHRTQLTSGHQRISAYSIAGDRAAILYSAGQQPVALAVVALRAGEKPHPLVDPNRERLAGCKVASPEEIWYESFDHTKIQGWILKPPGFDASRHYALLVSIHGGPHGAYGPNFSQELATYADHGYVVLYTNPRGSTGYGEAFGNSIQHKWPGDDIKDIMAGADFVLKKGYTDANRMAVVGGSGGGLMTAWIIGHTDRFGAAVSLYPVTNWFTHVGSDDNGLYIGSVYRKGMPWDYPEDYISHSPLFYAKNFKTPTMIISGDEDWRVPIAQSQELFRALKMRGVDTVLVRVPGESHGIRKRPSHQMAVLVHEMAWLDRYIDVTPR